MAPHGPPWHRDPTTGRLLLDAQHTVVLTGEEHHQDWLRRYVPHPGAAPRSVLLSLTFGLVTRGERAGQGTIEALLDGRRVGELTHRMTARYQPMLRAAMGEGGRPDCRGRLIIGRRGLVEVELRLPAVADHGAAGPVRPAGVGNGKRIGIGAAAITALLVLIGLGVAGGTGVDRARAIDSTKSSSASAVGGAAATTRSDSAAPIPASTTVPAPAQAPADRTSPTPPAAGSRVAAPVVQTTAAPRTAATKSAAGGCHPNSGGCVPLASDVDCEGGGGNGPKFVRGPIRVVGSDDYGLDRDGNGIACEPEESATHATTTTTRTTTATPTTTSKASPPESDDRCDPNYGGCVPVASDVDCAGGSGNGPKYVTGPVRVTGSDVYDLDRDGDGVACD
jgi:hypothetical protein